MNKKNSFLILFILILYIIVSLSILTAFPFVHSDETWLGGLSNTMILENSIKTTEHFFDLYPRHPHAIKILFNFIQIIFIEIFDFNIFTLRLISFIFSLAASYLFYRIVLYSTKSKLISSFSLFLLIFNIQFIYQSHMARQESILLFLLLLNFYFLYSEKEKVPLLSGIISGIAIGIHPNSFIIFLPILLFWILSKNKKDTLKYLMTVSSIALLFILFSFKLDPNFIHNYLNYGDELGVNLSFTEKIYQIKYFYLKLYYGVSGTYYTPNIKAFFYIFLSVITVDIYLVLKRILKPQLIGYFFAINLAYILIGRYNQTSIIFLLPFLIMMLADITRVINSKKILFFIIVFTLSITGINTFSNISAHYYSETYDGYINHLQSFIPKDAIVLANLNSLLAFETDHFYDYRNLGYLSENMTFEKYIEERSIEYIVYPEEMDFIYTSRPIWNGLYGNLYPYYEEMQYFLENDCIEVGDFYSPIYGMRIVRYIEDKDYLIRIYKVK
ncbi:MAG: glycosyltransferase family 39 protein [Clostridiales bacterium]|nr:glycosyltransferase family 39 protein [Clostridiales bacterium]